MNEKLDVSMRSMASPAVCELDRPRRKRRICVETATRRLEYHTPQKLPENSWMVAIEKIVPWLLLASIALVVVMPGMKRLGPTSCTRSRGNPQADLDDIASRTGPISKIDTGRLPTASEGLAVLEQHGDALPQGPYIKHVGSDPWRHNFHFQPHPDGINFTISSDGPDGIPGTRDDIVLDSIAK